MARLSRDGRAVRGAYRREGVMGTGAVIPSIDGRTDWTPWLEQADCVVHLAARVHVMRDAATDPLAEFRATNTAGTLNLAEQAARSGVRRFIFLSSIKVNGEWTTSGHPFRADDSAQPADPYGISKREAEDGLRRIASLTGMEAVIIRPVLVYGPNVRGNFLSMLRWISRGIPLPLGGLRNRRSLVFLENLVDLVMTCIAHPAAANQTFLVSDGEDLSTTELLRRTALAMGKPSRLIPVPAGLLEAGAEVVGRRDLAQRLCRSLEVDIAKTRQMLDWSPPVGFDSGLAATVRHFLAHEAR